jgi:hypothetical protein
LLRGERHRAEEQQERGAPQELARAWMGKHAK